MPAPRLPSLTSLRWFGASAVFLSHGEILIGGSSAEGVYHDVSIQGATGVSFFFILSGFVLAWTYRPDDTARAFWRRRVARIVPAYVAVWLLSWLVFVGLDHIHDPANVLKALFGITLLQAWVPDSNTYLGSNGVAWSLSAEAFFYALFPVAIAGVTRLKRAGVAGLLGAVVALSIVVPLVWHPVHSEFSVWAIYINPAYRLLEFVAGLCLATLLRDGLLLHIPPAAAMLLAVGAYLLAAHVPEYAAWVAVTVIPFAVLIFACAEADLAGRRTGLRHAALVRLGQWSFAFYLLHQLVTRTASRADSVSGSAAWRIALVAGSYAAAVAGAYLLFRFVEHPLEQRIRHG